MLLAQPLAVLIRRRIMGLPVPQIIHRGVSFRSLIQELRCEADSVPGVRLHPGVHLRPHHDQGLLLGSANTPWPWPRSSTIGVQLTDHNDGSSPPRNPLWFPSSNLIFLNSTSGRLPFVGHVYSRLPSFPGENENKQTSHNF